LSAAARSPTTGGPTAATRPTPRDRSGCVRFSGAVRSSRPSSMRPSMPSGQTRRRKRSAATGARCRNSCGGAGTGRLTTPRGQKIPKKSPKNSQIRGVKNTHPQIFGGEDISTPKKKTPPPQRNHPTQHLFISASIFFSSSSPEPSWEMGDGIPDGADTSEARCVQ